MNIVFFHGNGIVPTLGGISRITDTLGVLFVDKGNNVWYIGAQDKHKGRNIVVGRVSCRHLSCLLMRILDILLIL